MVEEIRRSVTEYQAMPVLEEGRIVFLPSDVDEESAALIKASLLKLFYANRKEDITLLITSDGGDVTPGLSIIDAIHHIQAREGKVIGQVWGHAESMACDVLQVCDLRRASSSSILMVHGGWSDYSGLDIEGMQAEAKVMKNMTDYMLEIYASRTKKPRTYWKTVMKRKNPRYFTSEEALEVGIIDEITE